jgi:1-acyl-sn-glycerol-3-phosphate acyltransferase
VGEPPEAGSDARDPDPAGGASPQPDPTAALDEALAALRRQIRARLDRRTAPVVRPTDWAELYQGLRRSLRSLGMTERSAAVDDFGLDETVLLRATPLLDFLFDRYWRVETHGLEELQANAPPLFVVNRAGLLPWDGLMVAHAVARTHPELGRPRFLVEDWLVTLPFVQPLLARVGGVRACRENAERLLRTGRPVVAFPEGAKGATKVFRERYRVQRFGRGGVVRTAIAARVPLVPVAVVGSEEVHPVLFKVQTAARFVGLPFLPVTPTFPWLGPLGMLPLPSKWSMRFGAPIETSGFGPNAVDDDLLAWRLTEELRARIQQMAAADVAVRASVWG